MCVIPWLDSHHRFVTLSHPQSYFWAKKGTAICSGQARKPFLVFGLFLLIVTKPCSHPASINLGSGDGMYCYLVKALKKNIVPLIKYGTILMLAHCAGQRRALMNMLLYVSLPVFTVTVVLGFSPCLKLF